MIDQPCTTAALAIQVLDQNAGAFMEHPEGVRADTNPEHVHDMRVATRRMRAAIRLFGDVLPQPQASALYEELDWIAQLLGAVRDLDVHLLHVCEAGNELHVLEAVRPYVDWLTERRQRYHSALIDALESQRFADLARCLTLLKVEWEPPDHTADRPISEDAPRRLRKAYQVLRKRAAPLDGHSPAPDLHKVRIRAKRLRYATEFFEPLYGKAAGRVVKRATSLQDLLGEIQDGVVGARRIQESVQMVGLTWPPATSLALGQLLQADLATGTQLRSRYRSTYRAVRQAWKRLRRDLGL